MNKIERIKLGRGPATVMGLAGMHCVRRCMCVFMLKSCDLAGIWWQMCAGIENACVHVKIMKLIMLELRVHVCVHVKTM
jgi:hypothetical protein